MGTPPRDGHLTVKRRPPLAGCGAWLAAAPAHLAAVSQGRLALYATGLFVLSRFVYLRLGVRFDASPLPEYWQYVDPALLRDDLLRSVLSLHSQPPLFNLFLGLVLKGSAALHPLVFHALYVTTGLSLYLATIGLMRVLGVSRGLALGLGTVWAFGPSAILYEHWLFYAYPLTALVTASALLLHAVLTRPGPGRALGFFAVVLLLCGTASPFHLAYYILVAAGVVVAVAGHRRTIVLAALGPLLALLLLYASHLYLFGQFTTQSWVGMSAAKVTLRHVPVAERERLVAAGILSPLALITPFSALDAYPAAYRQTPAWARGPVLTEAIKSTGYTNYNHAAYVGIAAQYLRDTYQAIRHYPRAFVTGIGTAWLYYFRSSTDYPFFEANRARIAPLVTLHDRLLYGRVASPIAYALDPADSSHLYLTLLVGLPLLVGFGLRRGWRGVAGGRARPMSHGGRGPGAFPGVERSPGTEPSRPAGWVLLYLCFTIVYVAVVANTLEVVENNRFRFMTEPFFLALLALWLEGRPWRGLRARAAPGA